jgi:two-component system, chemotaxis family, response regulator Rcp1
MTTDTFEFEVLLVEDNPADVRLTVEAFKEARAPGYLTVARDGIEAVADLVERNRRKAQMPDLILLDLNLPRMDGREVLGQIKKTPGLKQIPVVVLTTSRAEQDLLRSYELGANAFINKPADVDLFFAAMKSLASFWFETARLRQA